MSDYSNWSKRVMLEIADRLASVDESALDAAGLTADDLEVEERTALFEWSRRWPGYRFASTEDEGGFSWSACDGCGTTLGGTRHLAAAILESDPYDELPE